MVWLEKCFFRPAYTSHRHIPPPRGRSAPAGSPSRGPPGTRPYTGRPRRAPPRRTPTSRQRSAGAGNCSPAKRSGLAQKVDLQGDTAFSERGLEAKRRKLSLVFASSLCIFGRLSELRAIWHPAPPAPPGQCRVMCVRVVLPGSSTCEVPSGRPSPDPRCMQLIMLPIIIICARWEIPNN